MKKITLFFFAVFIAFNVHAQTVFWTEDFNNGQTAAYQLATGYTSVNGTWANQINGTQGGQSNRWYISSAECGNAAGVCGSTCTNDASLHVGARGVFYGGASYNAGGIGNVTTDITALSPIVNCTGYSTITLNFNYIGMGEPCVDKCDLLLSTDGGLTWATQQACMISTICGGGQGRWTSYSVVLPAAADNNPNVRIAFHWINNNNAAGSDPSFAVDDITFSVSTSLPTPVVTISPVGSTTICQNASITLNGSATNSPTSWQWTSSPSAGVTYSPASTSQNVTASFTTAGTYTFTLTATNGAGSGTSTQTVTVNATNAISVNTSSTPATPVCEGSPIAIQATATGGGLVPTYTWFENGVQMQSNNIPLYNTTANNNDTIIVHMTPFNVTCPLPAIASDTFVIQTFAPVTPTVTITSNPATFCAFTNATFTANPTNGGSNPGYIWLLNNFPVSLSNTYSDSTLSNGDTLIVNMLSNQTCTTTNTATDTFIVSIIPSPYLTVAQDTVSVCPGGGASLIANATAGSSYSWSPATDLNTTSNDTVIATINTIGTYTYVVTATLGSCIETKAVVVQVSNNLTTTISGANSICLGDTTQLTANNGSTWAWTPATGLSCTTCANPVASPTTSTVYTVNITSGTCNASGTHSLTVNSTAISVSINSTPALPVCEGSAIALTATSTNGGLLPTYTWFENGVQMQSNNLPLYNATANNNDTIIVQMIPTSNCPIPSVAIDTFIIQTTVPVTPSVNITVNPASFCANTNVTFTANPMNGGATPTYVWLLNNFPVVLGTNTYSSSTLADGDTVIVNMLSNQLCTTGNTASDTFVVHINPSPNLTVIQGSTTVCPGAAATLIVSAVAGSSFNWNPGTNLNTTTNDTVIATINTLGAFTYTVTSTLGSCTETQSITVTVSNNLTATITGATSICAGNSTNLNVNAGSNWSWSPAAGLSCTTCQNPVASPSSNTNYTVNVTSGSCSASATHSITINSEPSISVSPASICAGSSTTLTVGGSAVTGYQWVPATALSCTNCASPAANPGVSTTYTLVGTDANGCDDTTSVLVTVNPAPTLTIVQGDLILCQGQSGALVVNAPTGSTYNWSPTSGLNTTTNDSVLVSPTVSGATQYTVTSTLNGCSSQQTINVTLNNTPHATYNYTSGTGLPQTVGFTNTSINSTSYIWNFGDGSIVSTATDPSHIYTEEGTYTVTLVSSNSNGCGPDTISYVLLILDGSSVIVPNIFTPNGDQLNETLDIKTKGISELSCTIFDRWGLKISELSGTNPKWDGKTKSGNAAAEGTYYYVLKATGVDNKTFDLKGTVLLVK